MWWCYITVTSRRGSAASSAPTTTSTTTTTNPSSFSCTEIFLLAWLHGHNKLLALGWDVLEISWCRKHQTERAASDQKPWCWFHCNNCRETLQMVELWSPTWGASTVTRKWVLFWRSWCLLVYFFQNGLQLFAVFSLQQSAFATRFTRCRDASHWQPPGAVRGPASTRTSWGLNQETVRNRWPPIPPEPQLPQINPKCWPKKSAVRQGRSVLTSLIQQFPTWGVRTPTLGSTRTIDHIRKQKLTYFCFSQFLSLFWCWWSYFKPISQENGLKIPAAWHLNPKSTSVNKPSVKRQDRKWYKYF